MGTNLARSIVVVGFVALASGCGGSGGLPASDGAAGSGGAGADGGTAGGGGHAGGGGAPVSPCPSAAPADGSACSREGLVCEWGDDVRGDMCRTTATCTSSRWQVTAPAASCTPLTSVGACPADVTGSCTNDTTCAKADGSACRCTSCRPTAPLCGPAAMPDWYCPAPVTTAGCPPSPPDFGTACAKEGVECNYFAFECGVPNRVCSGGIWTPGQRTSCPMSTRNAKKDIRYVTPEGVDALAAETLRLRLATYEYKAPPLAGRRHLGFIIEDSPTAPAVDRDADMVDLYGYASMLLATTQAQQRKIDALERQVEALRQAVQGLRGARRRP